MYNAWSRRFPVHQITRYSNLLVSFVQDVDIVDGQQVSPNTVVLELLIDNTGIASHLPDSEYIHLHYHRELGYSVSIGELLKLPSVSMLRVD